MKSWMWIRSPLGHNADQVVSNRAFQIWSKPLADGTIAVGLFNLGDTAQTLKVRIGALGLAGPQPVRDLWLHQDLGDFSGAFATEVPVHGVALVKIGQPKS